MPVAGESPGRIEPGLGRQEFIDPRVAARNLLARREAVVGQVEAASQDSGTVDQVARVVKRCASIDEAARRLRLDRRTVRRHLAVAEVAAPSSGIDEPGSDVDRESSRKHR